MQDSNLPSHKKFIPEANSDIFPLFIYKYSAAATQEAALGTYTFSSTSHRILKTFPLSVSTFVLGDGYAHALYSLSLVEDPLWKRVCADILTLMGPIAAQLFQAHLGVPHNKAIDLY